MVIRRHSRRHNLLLVAISSSAALFVLVVLAEAVVRYRERHRASVPGSMPSLFYPHARLQRAMVRNFDYFGWVKVNSAGFRGPEVAEPKPEGVVRIMAVGGSVTFDFQVSGDDKAWPARLEHYLDRFNSRPRVEVINAGVGGYRVLDNCDT